MKKPFIAAAVFILGIMVIRIILSLTVGEHTAEIFTDTSFVVLFVFFITLAMRKRKEDNKEQ